MIQLSLDAILFAVLHVWGMIVFYGPYFMFGVIYCLQTVALGSPLDRAILFILVCVDLTIVFPHF